MLNQNSLNAVIGLADKLASKGLTLSAKQDTPLALLCSAGRLIEPTNVNIDAPVGNRILEASRSKNLQGICEHDLVMDEVVEVVKKTITWNLDLARNQINPAIMAGVEGVQNYVADKQALDPTLISIKPQVFHSIWGSHFLTGMIERYSETPVSDVLLDRVIPVDANRSGFELVDTGITSMNVELKSFIETLPADYVSHVYQELFGPGSPDTVSRLLSVINPAYADPCRVLVVFLLASQLLNNIPDGVAMSVAQYREFISAVLAQSGRALCRILTRREANVTNKALILDWSRNGADQIGVEPIVIQVNGDVYTKWLEAGGCPEVLFGAFVTDRNYSFDQLLERKVQYLSVWERQERVITTNKRLQKANHMQLGLARSIEAQIDAMPDEYLLTERSIYKTNLHNYIRNMPHNWHEGDVYQTVRKTICNVVFPHTNAFEILCAIDAACADNPELPVREAGLLAVTEIVSIWVAKLIDVN